jgi:hypothetical protein
MGRVMHHTLIVTAEGPIADQLGLIAAAGAFKQDLPDDWARLIVGPVRSLKEDYVTWTFLPDGSKEGWPESDAGGRFRQQFADLFAFRYDDGSTPIKVLLVGHGEGLSGAEVTEVSDPRQGWRTITYEGGRWQTT